VNLSDYPTPLTDGVYNTQWKDGNPETLASLMIIHSESLERKLAMCRERLRALAEKSSSTRIQREAKQTLAETK